MTLGELIESSLVKDDHNFMVHVPIFGKSAPIFGNVRQIRCGNWFNDQMLDLMDREIDRLTFFGSDWDVELQFPEK